MRRLGSALLAASLLAGCGGTEAEPSSESLQPRQAPLTGTDVDVAPECQGLLTFANGAAFATLDVYLPSDAASNLVAWRTTSPFTTLAEVSAVRLMGATRLKQLETGARTEGYIGPTCAGILDELAVSTDDEAAMVALVNGISSTELHDVLPDAWNGAENLLGLRPFTSAAGISNVAGIGASSFRRIRNAATLSRPLEDLIAAVAAVPQYDRGATLARHFDWWNLVMDPSYYESSDPLCFGLEPSSTPYRAVIRPNLADANEVRTRVMNAVTTANYSGQIPASVIAAGMANLDQFITGRTFKGCYFNYSRDPWSWNRAAFFVDTETGFGVLTESFFSE